MAISVVQTAPKSTTSIDTLTITFSSPSTAGNGVVVAVLSDVSGGGTTPTCADNKGNSYSLAVATASGDARARIFVCPLLTTGGASHTITVTGGVNWKVGTALEITGVGAGLLMDQTASQTGTSTTPATGSTAALTASEVLAVAAMAVDGAQGSITVQSVSPAWTQAIEELPFTTAPGEVDSRVLTGVSGTTQSCSWTNASSFQWGAALACFYAAAAPSAQLSQLPVEALVVSDAPVDLRLSQLPIEVLRSSTAVAVAGQVSQLPLEILLQELPASPSAGQLAQLPIEVLLTVEVLRASEVAATQLVTELAHVQPGDLDVTQIVTEVAHQQTSAIDVTQLVVEVLRRRPRRPVIPGTPGIAWIEWRGRGASWHTLALSDWDLQDPPAYYHGFKAARVESFGNATRALSDPRTGEWHGSSCEIRLADPDRGLRTILEQTPERFAADALVIVRMVSRPVRAALGEPLTVFAGPIRRAGPSPALSFTLLLEDAIGHGMLTDELRIPQRQVDASYLPATLVLDDDAQGHPVPIVYGTHARATGAVAPLYLGIEGGTEHVWLVAGHYAAVTDLFLDGLSVLGTEGSEWTVPGRSGPLVEDYGGRRYTLLRGRVGTPASVTDPVLYADNAGTVEYYFESWITGLLYVFAILPDSHWDANATTGQRSGTRCLHGVDLRTGDVAIGHFGVTGPPGTAVPRGYEINTYTALVFWIKNETTGWVDAVLNLRFTIYAPAFESVGILVTLEDGVYGFDSFNTADYQRIEIPIEDFEVLPEDLRPDRLWIVKEGDGDLSCFIDDISLIGGDEVEGEVTPADRAAGGAPLAINVTGWTTTGDETGTVIEDLYAQYQHFLITYVATPAGYLTGGPLANPTSDLYDRVVTVIDEASFTTAAAQAVTRYPPHGYRGRGVLGATAADRLSVRDWMARWNLSADCRLGVSRYGEVFIVLADPTAEDRDDAVLVDEVNDILEGSFSVELGWEAQATRVPYRADYDWATGTWLAIGRDADDNALSELYGRPAGIESPVKDYWFVPTSDQGKNVAEHEIQRIGHPPRVLEFETGLQLATAGLGGYLRVRHFAGVGPSEERLVQIEELTVAPGRRRVRVRAVDVSTLIPSEEELAARTARIGLARIGLMRVGYPG